MAISKYYDVDGVLPKWKNQSVRIENLGKELEMAELSSKISLVEWSDASGQNKLGRTRSLCSLPFSRQTREPRRSKRSLPSKRLVELSNATMAQRYDIKSRFKVNNAGTKLNGSYHNLTSTY